MTSSFYIGWAVSRMLYLNARSKLYNYPKGKFIGLPIFGSLAFARDSCQFQMALGNIGPISMTMYGYDNYVYLNDINLINSNEYRQLTNRNAISLYKDNINQFFFLGGDDNNWDHRRKLASNAFLNQLGAKYLGYVYSTLFWSVCGFVSVCIEQF